MFLGRKGVFAVLDRLTMKGQNVRIVSEAANVILNVCYERKNVQVVIELNGMNLLTKILDSKNESIQTNAAGAIQSICFQVKKTRDGGISLLNRISEGKHYTMIDVLGVSSIWRLLETLRFVFDPSEHCIISHPIQRLDLIRSQRKENLLGHSYNSTIGWDSSFDGRFEE